MDLQAWKQKLKQKARNWIKTILVRWFRVEVTGIYEPSKHTVIIANRTSVIDMLLLSVFLPERLTLALHPSMYKKIWVKMLLLFADVIVVDPSSALASRLLIKAIRSGKRCVIFPQGLVGAKEGGLKVFDGPGVILERVGAEVIPIRIEGAEYSIFSILKEKHRIQLFPKINLHVLPPRIFAPVSQGPVNRHSASIRLFTLISELSFANKFKARSLFSALIEGAGVGAKHRAKIEDMNGVPLSFGQFVARCFILGRQFKKQTQVGEQVGVMMPTTIAGMVSFFALQAYGRVPAMLNFSMGFYNLLSACNTAEIKTIYTSKQFIETAKLELLVEELTNSGLTVRYLEDFKTSIHLGNKLSGLLKGKFPKLAYRMITEPVDPEQTSLILFTSGSEGVPKGVALSHANILANCAQLTSKVDFNSRDIFFNALPIFHCFGLTAGSILPLIYGVSCFFYPSPLHYKIIPGLVYKTGATIMFGTDTFLTGYARVADNHDFTSVRYIFAGAEKVKPETINYWSQNYGVKIFEGYGATEASPVISTNCPFASMNGSVGMPLPMIETRIEPVEGIANGGRLFLRGPNIMRGYMRADKPGTLESLPNGWYDTGDIVTINNEGFITIAGRAKRFAKIAGEMVSLTAVEGIASSIWPELVNAAISIKCARKGEQILLFTESTSADKATFVKKVHEMGQSELLVPQQLFAGAKIPILPSGKIDYITLEKQTQEIKQPEAVV